MQERLLNIAPVKMLSYLLDVWSCCFIECFLQVIFLLQKGVHNGINTATKFMSKESGGRGGIIVNVSSTCGVTCHGDMYATPAYTASKHAVTALTRTFGV